MGQGDLFAGAPEPGTVVGGKYRLERMISEGGGGVVWEALEPEGRKVALKFLKWSPLKSRKVAAERFKNEFAILKSLSHPNISQIYDFGLDPASDLYFFTSELLTAGDLKAVIGEPIPALEELLLQGLRALEYLRGNKLLHLDIKPQNLLLRHDGGHPEMAMIDFGLATFRAPDKPGGTANYMPPEMIVRRLDLADDSGNYPPADHRSDLYSLGVTFYYLLTGIQPFCVLTEDGKRIDSLATLHRHLEYDPPPPSKHRREIPAYIDRVIMKLMARHPDDRYPSAIVAAQALQYSSPAAHAPESARTLLAYLPKEGKLVGRKSERAIIEESLRLIASGAAHAAPVICIAGGRGTGRSRLLAAAKPFAQQLEMDVTVVGEAGIQAAINTVDSSRAPSHLILMDDAERALDGNGAADSFRALIRRLRLQQRLKEAPGPKIAFIFSLNTDRLDLKRAALEANIDDTICHSIELANFTVAEVSEYLAALLGEAPDSAVAEQLARCTDGNPLFITEHLEEMIAKGRLFSLAGRPDAKTLKAIGVDFSQAPPSRSMAEAIEEKLSMLGPEAVSLALILACFGRPASAEELREASSSKTASHELLILVSAGLVRREPSDGRFAFMNALSAKIIRELAKPAARQHAHDSIAKYMKRRRAGQEDIDRHLAYGSRASLRPAALSRLASRALDRHEPEEAAAHLEALLEELPASDSRARADALCKLGAAFERARMWRKAQAAYRKLKQLRGQAEMGGDMRALSLEKLGLMAMRRRELKSARRLLEGALAIVKESPDSAAPRIRIENAIAGVDLRDGRFEDAVSRFERTQAVAEKTLSVEEKLSVANNELGEALLRLGQTNQALPILEADLSRARERGDEEAAARIHYMIGDALRRDEIGRWNDALSHYQQGLKLARAHRMVELEVRLHNGLGNTNLKTGKAAAALENYSEGLKIAQQIEGETTSVELMIGMGLAAQQMGKPDGTIEYFEAALEFASGPRGGSAGLIRRYRPTIVVSLGDAWYQKNDLDRAETYLKEALILDKKHALTPDIRYSLYGTQVEIHLARGEVEKARRHLPTLSAIAKAFPAAAEHLAQLESRLEL